MTSRAIVTRALELFGGCGKVTELLTCDGISFNFELGLMREVDDTIHMTNFISWSIQFEYPNLMQKIKGSTWTLCHQISSAH
jgi:hypothetical protein